MQLYIDIAGKRLNALVDSGSTHNFLAKEAAARTSVHLQHWPIVQVKVANDDRVTSAGIAKALPLMVDGEPIIIDCYAIPLGGFDIILGVQ